MMTTRSMKRKRQSEPEVSYLILIRGTFSDDITFWEMLDFNESDISGVRLEYARVTCFACDDPPFPEVVLPAYARAYGQSHTARLATDLNAYYQRLHARRRDRGGDVATFRCTWCGPLHEFWGKPPGVVACPSFVNPFLSLDGVVSECLLEWVWKKVNTYCFSTSVHTTKVPLRVLQLELLLRRQEKFMACLDTALMEPFNLSPKQFKTMRWRPLETPLPLMDKWRDLAVCEAMPLLPPVVHEIVLWYLGFRF